MKHAYMTYFYFGACLPRCLVGLTGLPYPSLFINKYNKYFHEWIIIATPMDCSLKFGLLDGPSNE